MNCPTCKFEIPDGVNFCSNCGAELSNPLTIVRMQASVQQQIDGFVKEHLRELDLREREALDRFDKSAINRLKFWVSVLAMIIGAFTYVGINRLNVVEVLSKQTESFHIETKAIRDATKAVGDDAKESLVLVNEATAKIKTWEDTFNKAAESAEGAEELYKIKTKELKDETGKLDQALNAATVKMEDLEYRTNLEINAKYTISVHIPGGDDKTEQFLLRLQKILGNKGFVVKAEDTLRVKVEESKILYYFDGDKDRAEIIQSELQDKFSLRLKLFKETVPSRNYEIQIMLNQIPQVE